MAKGDKKRTYKVTDESVQIIDHMEDKTILDKSDFVDRAVKYYWYQLKSGELDDPILSDDSDSIGDIPDVDGSSSSSTSIMDRLRGKK